MLMRLVMAVRAMSPELEVVVKVLRKLRLTKIS
jgi:hypothetical protein